MPSLWAAELHSPRQPREMVWAGVLLQGGRGIEAAGTSESSLHFLRTCSRLYPQNTSDTSPPSCCHPGPSRHYIFPRYLSGLPPASLTCLFAPSIHFTHSNQNDLSKHTAHHVTAGLKPSQSFLWRFGQSPGPSYSLKASAGCIPDSFSPRLLHSSVVGGFQDGPL